MPSRPDRRRHDATVGDAEADRRTQRAAEILRALRDVLSEAAVRGIALSASFLHFDRRQQGLVGVDDLTAALVELRVLRAATSQDDVAECVYELSLRRSRAYFSRDDFVAFFSQPPPGNNENAYDNDASSPQQKQQHRHKQKPKTKPIVEEEMRFSLSNNDTVGLSPEAKKSKKLKRPLGSLLPNWAHARSKRALHELESLAKRHGRGVETRPLSRSTLMSSGDQAVPPLGLVGEGSEDVEMTESDQVAEPESARSVSTASDDQLDVGDLLQFPVDPRWKLFDLDDDTTLSYVVMTHDTCTTAQDRRLPATPSAWNREEEEDLVVQFTSFRFTVFLDAFQRVETIETFFAPLLTHFPRGKVLICGFPTKMRRQTVLNNVFLAAAYAKLLIHVMETTREWLVQPKMGVAAMPQFVLGFGSGAQVALQLLTSEIPEQATHHSSLRLFAQAQRGLVLVNGMLNVSEGTARAKWNTWRRLLSAPEGRNTAVEWHEALLRTVFSDHYLTQVARSREQALEEFFYSRKHFLQGKSVELLRALVRGTIKNGECELGNLSVLCRQPFGVVAVHGTLDELAPAVQVEKIAASGFCARADSVGECLSSTRSSDAATPLHLAWLKSGHELLQERAHFVYELMRQLILTPVMEPLTPVDQKAEVVDSASKPPSRELERVATDSTASTEMDVDMSEPSPATILLGGQPAPTRSAIGARVRDLMASKGLKWIQQELYDRELDGAGATDVILERYEQVLLREAQLEHERQQKELAKRRKREAFEAEKHAQKIEELERIVREQEIEKSIKRKAYEAQKRFFEQMEEQKLLQAKWLDEHRQMALEDAFSLKFNEQMCMEEEREGRNKQMSKKVAALERERQEQERERFQVELQHQRLEQQHKKREDLKRFQKEFEQNQFVCSAVEEYRLDLAPEYANFPNIVAGGKLLAQDLTRFYELKQSQLEDSNEKRQQLQVLKNEIAEKDTELRNLERVLLKAKSTGMIAKAGLGTVRVVAITPAEVKALARELDEKRDVMARLLHDQNSLVQQLAWQDKMLQQLSVLIKRNEGFRVEMLAKIDECANRGNEMVLCVREDMEAIMDKREVNEKKMQRIKIRLQLVCDEMRRAEASETQYFDSRLRVEGSTQRVLRHVLLKELSIEKEELDKQQMAVAQEETHCRSALKERKKTLEEYAATTFQVETCKKILDAAVPLVVSSQAADTSTTSASVNANGDVSLDGGSLSEQTRQKKHVDRSLEEKRWVAMDFELHFAYYYKHVDAAEVEIIQRHPDYQNNKLKKPQLERLLSLPARNCLALAFLKSQEELEAHGLLRKYTFGDGDDYFMKLDRGFDLPGSLDPAARVVSALEELVSGLEKAENPILRSRSVVFSEKMTDGGLPVPSPPLSILSASQQQIPPHKTVTHALQLPSAPTAVLSLTVSIVFQGHFKSTGYQNGRLAAMLYVLPPSSSSVSVISAPLAIGACLTQTDIALCTPHSLGKLVLRHDPTKKPLSADVTYQVVLGAPVLTTYSIQITAQTAIYPGEVLRKKRADALKKQELLPMKKDEVQNVFTTIQLSERKKRLARKMANEAKDAARQAEVEMLRQSKLMEADNAAPTLPQDERRALHAKIQEAETTFTQQCFLFAQREEEVRDIEAGLKELTKIHADLLEEIDRMERDLDEYREFLPPLAAILVESKDNSDRDAAGARIARELNVEYVSRYGARSGKVIWAELSAMKAKLPSMMTPAERLRRKYKKGVDVLEKKEREWILLDRILYSRKYDWEDRLVVEGDSRMRLHGTHPRLTKDEEMLAVLSQMEVERIMKAPWNLLERKEIQVRKIVTRFRDDVVPGGTRKPTSEKKSKSATSTVSMLRGQKPTELTSEEREWRLYDQMLNPVYYPVTLKNIADDVAASKQHQAATTSVPGHITREDLVHALNTPEEELFKLPSELLHARNLLFKFDPQLSTNLLEAARMQHAQDNAVVEKVEMDVDARCRLVYAELQRAIANTRNEFMDSSALHTTMQRFPTKVLRLELEKELDRILMGQIQEKEKYELDNFLKKGGGSSVKEKRTKLGLGGGAGEVKRPDEDSVSESDSDEEAQIAREQREQKRLKEAVKNGAPREKVRGKALKTKSIQKQRREIKDALQGRSLEEQRRLLEEQELGVGGCMACRHNPCQWKPYLQESIVSINSRVETLQEELERIKRAPDLVIESSVCLAAVKSGNRAIVMRKADLFDEVTLEIKIWDKHLRLRAVDKEFHDTFTSKEQYFETQALHGFRQIQLKPKVQVALQREHNLLVSNLTAYEVVEDILEFMLEGWVFGERESERKAMGYVPSLKREGPLTMHDLRQLEEEKRLVDAQNSLKEEENVQGIPLDKWKPIEVAAFEINEKNKAVKKGSDLDKQLTETENALKFGIFCMTLMYFRGLSLLKKQKTVWSTSALRDSSKQPVHSSERKRREMEARNAAARQKKAELYDAKARLGQARKQKLEDQRTAAYRKRMVLENQKAKREDRAAVQIQRIFRGFMGRRAGRKWMLRRREIDAQRALDKAAAITLQRAYRGRLGRLQAEERRIELAEFISQIRAEEAIEEEEEYWRKHRVERIARQVAAYVKKQA